MESFPKRQNQIQYFLQGSIKSERLDPLLHRLRGLCQNDQESDIEFDDHEMIYMMKNNSTSLSVRVRRSLKFPENGWQLRYLGNPEGLADRTRAASVCACIEVMASNNSALFLESIGFRFDHELVLKGYSFKKGAMKVTVSRIHKVATRGDIRNCQPLTDSYFVELIRNSPVQEDKLCEEMKTFAENLKPLVTLKRVDAL